MLHSPMKKLMAAISLAFLAVAAAGLLLVGCSAKPTNHPMVSAGPMIGKDDPLADFTISAPMQCTSETGYKSAYYTLDGLCAGGVDGSSSYYLSAPGAGIENGDLNQLLNGNHSRLVEPLEEVDINFADNGAWRKHLTKVVKAHCISDVMDDDYPNSGTYEHTTYFLIFDDEASFVSGDEIFTYASCYQLDYIHEYRNGDAVIPILPEDDVLPYVESFALKGENPYRPAYSYEETQAIAYAALQSALDEGAPQEARDMREALGDAVLGGEAYFTSFDIIAEGDTIIRTFIIESGGVRATVRVDMDQGMALGIAWEA